MRELVTIMDNVCKEQMSEMKVKDDGGVYWLIKPVTKSNSSAVAKKLGIKSDKLPTDRWYVIDKTFDPEQVPNQQDLIKQSIVPLEMLDGGTLSNRKYSAYITKDGKMGYLSVMKYDPNDPIKDVG